MNGEGNGRCIMLALAELILFAVAAVAIGIVARKGSPISKKEGSFMLIVFAIYYGYIVTNALVAI